MFKQSGVSCQILYYIVSYYTILYYTILYLTLYILTYTILYYTMLSNTILYHIISYHIISYHTILCYFFIRLLTYLLTYLLTDHVARCWLPEWVYSPSICSPRTDTAAHPLYSRHPIEDFHQFPAKCRRLYG